MSGGLKWQYTLLKLPPCLVIVWSVSINTAECVCHCQFTNTSSTHDFHSCWCREITSAWCQYTTDVDIKAVADTQSFWCVTWQFDDIITWWHESSLIRYPSSSSSSSLSTSSGCYYYCCCEYWWWWWFDRPHKFPSVLWHCWFGHLTCKIVPEMAYNVSSGTLNPTHSLT